MFYNKSASNSKNNNSLLSATRSSFRNKSRSKLGGLSLNSSRNSSGGDGEEMYSDGSLEDEVIDLTQKVNSLEEKFSVLAESQSESDERFARSKQENIELSTKLYMLEEQLRETEQRGEERVKEEQKRLKEALQRVDRERESLINNYEAKIGQLEKDLEITRTEREKNKKLLEREKSEKAHLSEKVGECLKENIELREENKKLQETSRSDRDALILETIGSQQALMDLKREFETLRKYQMGNKEGQKRENYEEEDYHELRSRLHDYEEEIRRLKSENRELKEMSEDLTAQILNHGLEEGRQLLALNHSGLENSLAAEFEAMSQDEMKCALKEQKDVNDQLKTYIDNILLNIVENYPQLLEVKNKVDELPNF